MAQKTLVFLKSRFETGDIPTGEDYENLLDSFWHKSDLGRVASGDQRPVTGGAVYEAIASMISRDTIKAIVAEVLEELLPPLLAEYVTGSALATALSGKATEVWVTQQLASYPTATAVNTALAGKADIEAVYTREAADLLLADKARTSDLPEVRLEGGVITINGSSITPLTEHQDICGKLDASAVGIANGVISINGATITPITRHQDTSGFATKAELTAAQTALNTAIAAKADTTAIPSLTNYVTTTDLNTALAGKLDASQVSITNGVISIFTLWT